MANFYLSKPILDINNVTENDQKILLLKEVFVYLPSQIKPSFSLQSQSLYLYCCACTPCSTHWRQAELMLLGSPGTHSVSLNRSLGFLIYLKVAEPI